MLAPKPDNDGDSNTRQQESQRRRDAATAVACRRPQPTRNNGEVDSYRCKPTSFHKGLPHDEYGAPDPTAFADLVSALNRDVVGDGDYATFDVALGPLQAQGRNKGNRSGDNVEEFFGVVENGKPPAVRNWESPLGGRNPSRSKGRSKPRSPMSARSPNSSNGPVQWSCCCLSWCTRSATHWPI